MKVLAVFVLVFVTIAYAQIRLYPESMRDKWAQWDRENENPSRYQRIVNGQAVSSGGRPFQVLLARNGAFTCGGSLIASNKVATAAHCVYGNEGSPTSFSVRYNTLTQTGGQSITVSSIARHASYNSGTINYDFAVLTLASAFTPGTNAATITIATANPSAGATAISSGWGRTVGGGAVSQNLMQTSYSVLSNTDCQSRMGSINTITTQMICGYTSGTGICNGDSGGPMTVSGQLVGIHSWVVGSCLTSYPSVSANAVTARAWLLAN